MTGPGPGPGSTPDGAGAVERRRIRPAAPSGGTRRVVLLTLGFAAADLARLRLRIGLGALDAGLDADRTADFVLAVNEMAENAIVHGGGQGRLLLATEDGDLQCSITDSGPGFRQRPAPGPELTGPGTAAVPDGHRGIPLARQLTDSLHIATTGAGTTVTVLVRVG